MVVGYITERVANCNYFVSTPGPHVGNTTQAVKEKEGYWWRVSEELEAESRWLSIMGCACEHCDVDTVYTFDAHWPAQARIHLKRQCSLHVAGDANGNEVALRKLDLLCALSYMILPHM
jgi:hypothetical protein